MELEIMDTINTVSEIELIYKSKVPAARRPKVTNAEQAYEIFLKYWDQNKMEIQEQAYALFLNTDNSVLAIYPLSIGGIESTVVDGRLLFTAALKLKAAGILLCHNHPTGSMKPSNADKETTERLKKGGEILKIKLLDHLIITKEGYYSMSENGLL